MKSFGLKLLIVLMVFVSFVEAKGVKIFDLKAQYFSKTLPKEGKNNFDEFKYDLKNVIVTTDARNIDGAYLYGLFTVDIKEPIKNWNINIKERVSAYRKNEMTAIRITSDNGTSYYITFAGASYSNDEYIQINDKKFKICCIHGKKFSISISSKNNKTLFTINGKKFLKTDSKDFGNLAKVEIELNDNNYDDALYSLDIYKVE